MRVVVASPTDDCVAHRALEGVEHDLLLCGDDYAYGKHLARLWREGEGFILLEWDVIPRPGVIARLSSCEKEWCAWPYDDPNPKADEPVVSLGCMKFGTGLLRRHPDIAQDWGLSPWESVEGTVLWSIREATGEPYPHLHGGGRYTKKGMVAASPLAHLKAG